MPTDEFDTPDRGSVRSGSTTGELPARDASAGKRCERQKRIGGGWKESYQFVCKPATRGIEATRYAVLSRVLLNAPAMSLSTGVMSGNASGNPDLFVLAKYRTTVVAPESGHGLA